MKVIVKAKYITYATVEVDAKDEDEANMRLDVLAKHCPTEFLDTWKTELDEYELDEILEGYKYG
ncbi:hypothetical protein JJQ58_00985 [Mammaliicoccus fleurettii]|uniref:Uncharacterized protein n=1 Tax=Mammaliicoccus fleurettii TaxID=150056 RepID=A0ABS5MJH6_9STAP|nr:hypothetical protein [Mammaliicoccus fleurettii]MBL0846553.1 hypothetical protein [Mammaliicoccus fleurettii]MBS3670994.1 hypothetical protein [Mammaliicoccus fleurettii]MBS3696053.1 hypothetical protein [Mammaliicoccus fleurettii]